MTFLLVLFLSAFVYPAFGATQKEVRVETLDKSQELLCEESPSASLRVGAPNHPLRVRVSLNCQLSYCETSDGQVRGILFQSRSSDGSNDGFSGESHLHTLNTFDRSLSFFTEGQVLDAATGEISGVASKFSPAFAKQSLVLGPNVDELLAQGSWENPLGQKLSVEFRGSGYAEFLRKEVSHCTDSRLQQVHAEMEIVVQQELAPLSADNLVEVRIPSGDLDKHPSQPEPTPWRSLWWPRDSLDKGLDFVEVDDFFFPFTSDWSGVSRRPSWESVFSGGGARNSEDVIEAMDRYDNAEELYLDMFSEGCYARTHLVGDYLKSQGFKVAKIWVAGYNLWPKSKPRPLIVLHWTYHVALVVEVAVASGGVEWRVLDPSLSFTPMNLEDFLGEIFPQYKGQYLSSSWPMPENATSFAHPTVTVTGLDHFYFNSPPLEGDEEWQQSLEEARFNLKLLYDSPGARALRVAR